MAESKVPRNHSSGDESSGCEWEFVDDDSSSSSNPMHVPSKIHVHKKTSTSDTQECSINEGVVPMDTVSDSGSVEVLEDEEDAASHFSDHSIGELQSDTEGDGYYWSVPSPAVTSEDVQQLWDSVPVGDSEDNSAVPPEEHDQVSHDSESASSVSFEILSHTEESAAASAAQPAAGVSSNTTEPRSDIVEPSQLSPEQQRILLALQSLERDAAALRLPDHMHQQQLQIRDNSISERPTVDSDVDPLGGLHALARRAVDLPAEPSRLRIIRPQFEEESLPESDLSIADSASLDNSDMAPPVALMEVASSRRHRQYRHSPNERVNSRLTLLCIVVLSAVVGLGVGHFVGSAKERHYHRLFNMDQNARMRSLQDDLVQCVQKYDDMEITVNDLKANLVQKEYVEKWESLYQEAEEEKAAMKESLDLYKSRYLRERGRLAQAESELRDLRNGQTEELATVLRLRNEVNMLRTERDDLRRSVLSERYRAMKELDWLRGNASADAAQLLFMRNQVNALRTENQDLQHVVLTERYTARGGQQVRKLRDNNTALFRSEITNAVLRSQVKSLRTLLTDCRSKSDVVSQVSNILHTSINSTSTLWNKLRCKSERLWNHSRPLMRRAGATVTRLYSSVQRKMRPYLVMPVVPVADKSFTLAFKKTSDTWLTVWKKLKCSSETTLKKAGAKLSQFYIRKSKKTAVARVQPPVALPVTNRTSKQVATNSVWYFRRVEGRRDVDDHVDQRRKRRSWFFRRAKLRKNSRDTDTAAWYFRRAKKPPVLPAPGPPVPGPPADSEESATVEEEDQDVPDEPRGPEVGSSLRTPDWREHVRDVADDHWVDTFENVRLAMKGQQVHLEREVRRLRVQGRRRRRKMLKRMRKQLKKLKKKCKKEKKSLHRGEQLSVDGACRALEQVQEELRMAKMSSEEEREEDD